MEGELQVEDLVDKPGEGMIYSLRTVNLMGNFHSTYIKGPMT
jgi:hypothetical protein